MTTMSAAAEYITFSYKQLHQHSTETESNTFETINTGNRAARESEAAGERERIK